MTDPNRVAYCDLCKNTGEVDCYCGGDLCVCDNNGVYPCPACDGGDLIGDDEYPE